MEHWNEGNLQALTSRRPKSNDERPLRGKKIERVEFANPETGSDVSVQFFFLNPLFFTICPETFSNLCVDSARGT